MAAKRYSVEQVVAKLRRCGEAGGAGVDGRCAVESLFHNDASRRQQMMAQPRCMNASCIVGSRS